MTDTQPSALDAFNNATEEFIPTEDPQSNDSKDVIDGGDAREELNFLSEVPPELVLNRLAKIATLPNKMSTELTVHEMKLGEFLGALCRVHSELRTKDGPVFLQGAAQKDTKRYLETMEILAFDVDDGPDPQKILRRFEALGVGAVIYPSFNDERRYERIGKSLLHKWVSDQTDKWSPIEKGEIATDEQILAYFRQGQPQDVADKIHSPRFKEFRPGLGGRRCLSGWRKGRKTRARSGQQAPFRDRRRNA